MLQPKRTKFRKMQKGRNRGLAERGSKVSLENTRSRPQAAAVSLPARLRPLVVL